MCETPELIETLPTSCYPKWYHTPWNPVSATDRYSCGPKCGPPVGRGPTAAGIGRGESGDLASLCQIPRHVTKL